MDFLNVPFGEPVFVDPDKDWLRYGPFAMWLVHAQRPRNILEVGTNTGFFYFSFCQAIAEREIEAECFAVSNWRDNTREGSIPSDAFEQALLLNQRYTSFSRVVNENVSHALDQISDKSVDILSVDARNCGRAVAEDFEKWTVKLSSRAVVLIYGMGTDECSDASQRQWQMIVGSRPSLTLPHRSGLTMLFWGDNISDSLKPLFRLLSNEVGRAAVTDAFLLAGEAYVRSVMMKDAVEEFEHDLKNAAVLHKNSGGKRNVAVSENLEKLLQDARNRPLKQLRKKLVFKFLNILASGSGLFSPRMVERFKRSAAKRDPMRTEIQQWRAAEMSYEKVLSQWARLRQNLSADLRKLALDLQDAPLISLVVPVYNPQPRLLSELIDSVRAQSYPNWELCLADDCSTDPVVRRVLEDYERRDDRIRIIFREENGHISKATNSAIEIAKGKYIALVDHDDLLDHDALLLVAQMINVQPDVKIIYTDEDKIREDGTRYDPHFKPDWNRELLYGMNYISHLGVYDAELVRKVGAFRAGFEGAQDYDLLLRCIELVEDRQIRHIPKVLYSWRASPGSTAASNESKPYATEAGRLALQEHLYRTVGKDVPVVAGPFPFSYRVLWPVEGKPLVSIIMPTRDHLNVLKVAVESILEKTNYHHFELIIVDNQSVNLDTLAWLDQVQKHDRRVRVIRDERPFNYSALNNNAVAQSNGEIIALVNNDIEVISPDWLSEMVGLTQRPGVGCVGAKLLYPDGRLQHAGVVIGMGGVAGHGHHLFPRDHGGYFGRLKLRQSYSAVTAACLTVRREVYDRVGGLNEEDLAVAFNDVDFCLRIRAAGYENVWTPWAELYHHESLSRGYEDTPEKKERFKKEVEFMRSRWKTNQFPDPAYNSNLSRNSTSFVMDHSVWLLDDVDFRN
ncbi:MULTISPECIES: glycosyltransferase [Rhizobium/Agrobacterium group]|nr:MULTISPECIES: glycosyltransferase [Rhizobium/Agrobacterium group]AKC10072.1 hypothetical protein Ach5_42990 [Agrobacterium tumefaciens]AYM19216.1 hypothetical protein At15955_42310 [Agrobacterium tumefaciens]AYM70517.1 hypothetical protein AtA6_43010 [Agrobacterium tumefaciens]